MQLSTSRLLVIENESIPSLVEDVIEKFKTLGSEVRTIERAYHKLDEVKAGLAWCDSMTFMTTWLYKDQVHAAGMPLTKIQPITIYVIAEDQSSLTKGLTECFNMEELAAMRKHRVVLTDRFMMDDNACIDYNWNWFDAAFAVYERQIVIDLQRKQRKQTGRLVRIMDINAQGPEFRVLKNGLIVPEVERPEDDPDRSTGTWVQGLTEPVKLLNNRDMQIEWQYAERKKSSIMVNGVYPVSYYGDDIAREIGSIFGWLTISGLMTTFTEFLKTCACRMEEPELWLYVTDMLDSYNLPRRTYRRYIVDRITEYAKEHQYFKETA